jgi:hypothetical protein
MNNSTDFDFDAWSKLAQDDPAAFEAQRAKAIAELLDSAPPHLRKRLDGLQWRIDCVRQQAQNPMGACMRISRMMWDAVLGERGLAESLRSFTDAGTELAQHTEPSATVVPLRPE